MTEPGVLNGLIRDFNEGRAYLIDELDQHGYAHQGDAGNFLFIKPRKDAAEIVRRMKEEEKILIKTYAGVGKLGDCLRVTIGARPYMERFLQAFFVMDAD